MAGNERETHSEFSARQRAAERARKAFETGASPVDIQRGLLDSWRRSRRAVPTDLGEAPANESRTAVALFRESRLFPACRDVLPYLVRMVDRQVMVAALFDQTGQIVWQHASAPLRKHVERVNFVPGGRWDELSTGTSAPALALRGQAADVFASEHYLPVLADWACCAVPVIDPTTRRVLGALNLSCLVRDANPLLMPLADSITRRIEDQLVGLAPTHRLCVLGRGELWLRGQAVRLPPRQLEILLALAQARDGLSLEQLYVEVYERDDVHLSSLKAEVSRLRSTLDGLLGSRPYRLDRSFSCDLSDLLQLLARGDLAGALDLYTGPILPWSSAPVACRLRAFVRTSLRTQAEASGNPRLWLRYLSAHPEEADALE